MTTPKRLLPLLILSAISLSLSACGTPDGATPQTSITQTQISSETLHGEGHDNLATIKALYAKNSKDPVVAARYGKALREAGDFKEAKSVLLPHTHDDRVGTLVNSELSAVYLSLGQFQSAESAARAAIKLDETNYRAWRNLGNALDAQEKYVEGETAFRKALDLWGNNDKVPVMNNLALNLAAQGHTDQALQMLLEAQRMAPDRVEIERNIRIIRTLSEPAEFKGIKHPFPENIPPTE